MRRFESAIIAHLIVLAFTVIIVLAVEVVILRCAVMVAIVDTFVVVTAVAVVVPLVVPLVLIAGTCNVTCIVEPRVKICYFGCAFLVGEVLSAYVALPVLQVSVSRTCGSQVGD